MSISKGESWKSVIKILRDFSGKSQEDFGREIGVRANSISRWERGDSIPGKLGRRNIVKYYFLHKSGFPDNYMKKVETFFEKHEL